MKTGPVAVVCVVAATLAATFIVVERNRQSAELSKLEKKVAALAERPASGASDDERPSAPSRSFDAPPVIAAAPPSAGVTVAPPSPPVAAPQGPSASEVRDNLEIAFGGDHRDSIWSGADQRRTTQKLEGALPEGSSLKSLDCRASICRVETSHADLAHYKTFVRTAFMNPTTQIWNAPSVSMRMSDVDTPGAALVTVSYIAREGQDLPRFD
jgi:hypothetical protein